MTKLAAMSMYGKIFKNLLFWNLKADDLEIWYAALSTQVFIQIMFLGWPCLILRQVKFGPLCFCMGKDLKQWIFQKLL